ncbi:hypothetical protein FRC04_008561 [Tulasnella sp. 424]|nr:hypothetical protein FRC04_008561 [Tulasnella sp. 424]
MADSTSALPHPQTLSQTDLDIRSLTTALALFSPNSGDKNRYHQSGRYDQFDRMSLFFVSGASGDVAATTALVEDNHVTFQTVQAESDAGRLAVVKNPDYRGPKHISPKAHGVILQHLLRCVYQTETADDRGNATRVLRRYLYSFCFDKILRRFKSKITGYQSRYKALFLSTVNEITLDDYRANSTKDVVIPRRLATKDESTLKIVLKGVYPERKFELSTAKPYRLILDIEEQWAVWTCFKDCLGHLETTLTNIQKLKIKRDKIKEEEFQSALDLLDEVEEYMGFIFLLAHHSPSFWIVMERMAPLLERRLGSEIHREQGTPSTGRAFPSQESVGHSPPSTAHVGQPTSPQPMETIDVDNSDESDDEDATSDVETTGNARSGRKTEQVEDMHDVISKFWSQVTRMTRHWMKSITQWHHGFEDLERGPKKLGILSKNLAIDVTVAPISPSPNQQASLVDTVKSIFPKSDVNLMIGILRTNAVARCQSGAREGLLQTLANRELTDEAVSDSWGSGFRGGIHCEAQLAYKILQKSPAGQKCLIGISKRCCFCCAALLKALNVNDGDIVEHGKVYSWSPPLEATEETKQNILKELRNKFKLYLESQCDQMDRTSDSGSSNDSEDDQRTSMPSLMKRLGQRMAQERRAE